MSAAADRFAARHPGRLPGALSPEVDLAFPRCNVQLLPVFARLQPGSIPIIARIGLRLLHRSALRLQRVFNTVVAATAFKLLRNSFASARCVGHRRVVGLH
ncbi:hypothetical protein OKW45_000519 [Paraburkholderia sp. WSM4175]